MTEATERAPVAPLHSFPRHLPLPLFSFPSLLSSPSISLALCCREAAMDARGPPLRPMPRRPCRRRRLGRPSCPLQELRADPAAWRPPPPIRCRESPDPAPLRPASPSFVRSRYLPGARSSGERRHKTLPPLPRSSPWRSSPLHLNPRWSPPGARHGGCRLSCLDPSAAGSTAEQPRSAARYATPRPAKASAEADKARRKAKALTKQREDLRARLAYRKRARKLTSMPAKATAATLVFF